MSRHERWRFWAWPRELKRRGILGINERNLRLIAALNPRSLYPRVDDKAVTKGLCDAKGIPVPRTYAIIERYGDIRRFAEAVDGLREFAVKPACGSAGRGVIVVAGRDGERFRAGSSRTLSLSDFHYHLSTILSGLYSLGGDPDKAIVEERIAIHPDFYGLAFEGTPDLRIIVCRGRPLMAMLRLPTRQSGGRANLHQGAVGVGIDLATGRAVGGVHRDRAIDAHPDSGLPLSGIAVPFWPASLDIASRLGRAIGLGYIGVDLVLDAARGPIVLEANARPGLAIQIANRAGLIGPTRAAANAESA